jgi:hypothetical protein
MSSENVVSVDFGAAQRESARKLARLLGLADELERRILADPKPFIDRAHDEIIRLRETIRRAQESTYQPFALLIEAPELPPNMDVVCVRADEYRRLKAMERIILDLRL